MNAMTTLRPRPSGRNMVKGLTKSRNHLHHAENGKSVDVSPFHNEGRLLPNDGRKYTSALYAQMKQLRGAKELCPTRIHAKQR